MVLKTMTIINGIIQAILITVLLKNLFDYMGGGNTALEKELAHLALIIGIIACLFLAVLPYFATRRAINHADNTGDYSKLRANSITKIFSNAFELFLLVIISEKTVFSFLVEEASMSIFEARYLAEMYVIIQKYGIMMSVVSLIFAIISCSVVQNYKDIEYNDSQNKSDDEFYNGRRYY